MYSYTIPDVLEANHYYDLSGTYKSSKAQLSVTLTATSWGEDRSFSFDFDESNLTPVPVAGEYYNDYYVVSVNEQERTAVLLSEKIPYDAPEDAANAALWQAELETRMAILEKPANTTNNWRLPTIEEVKIFTKDPNAVTFDSTGISAICFCKDANGNLAWAYTKKEGDDYQFVQSSSTPKFTANLRLRPVIDITY